MPDHFDTEDSVSLQMALWSLHGEQTNLEMDQFFRCLDPLFFYVEHPTAGREKSIERSVSHGLSKPMATELLGEIISGARRFALKWRMRGLISLIGGLLFVGLSAFGKSEARLGYLVFGGLGVLVGIVNLFHYAICIKRLRPLF